MMGALLALLMMGVMGIVALVATFAILGVVMSMVFGAVGFLLFKVLPLLLIGYLVVKLVERTRSPNRISAADQRWLDGE